MAMYWCYTSVCKLLGYVSLIEEIPSVLAALCGLRWRNMLAACKTQEIQDIVPLTIQNILRWTLVLAAWRSFQHADSITRRVTLAVLGPRILSASLKSQSLIVDCKWWASR
jgi:hypothetical protein